MAKRYYNKQNLFKPLVDNISARLSRADSRLRRSVVRYTLFGVGIFVIYSFLAGPYGYFRISRLEERRELLILENKQLLAALVDADQRRDRLINDPLYIEFIARTRYLMALPATREHPGETMIRISE
ncbi:septum formation initiator family protein [Gemmatimonas aurantiaca]|nr:septum formation initiator family protein [Gemmatimonas aurantiaca]